MRDRLLTGAWWLLSGFVLGFLLYWMLVLANG